MTDITGTAKVWRGARRHGSCLFSFLHVKLWLAHLVCAPMPQFWSGQIRAVLYRAAGFDVHTSASIFGNIEFTSGLPDLYSKLTIGRETIVSTRVTINLDDRVHIGDRVTIGPHVLIYSGNHRLGSSLQRCDPDVAGKPVHIGDGCWIRVGAIILPGVTVGDGSIVAAGAVVSRDVPPNTLVEGNPARVVKELRGTAGTGAPAGDSGVRRSREGVDAESVRPLLALDVRG
jgi:acetyltransferase-like isoleucine patch superfamily enzyme